MSDSGKKWCKGPCHPQGVWLPLSDFHRNARRDDGYQVHCKECARAYRGRGSKQEDWFKRSGRRMPKVPGAEGRLERFLESDGAEARLAAFLAEDGAQ